MPRRKSSVPYLSIHRNSYVPSQVFLTEFGLGLGENGACLQGAESMPEIVRAKSSVASFRRGRGRGRGVPAGTMSDSFLFTLFCKI